MNCKPGDLAVLVNEDHDCLCNIGALVTITQLDDVYRDSWLFKDASRPLKSVGNVDGGPVAWCRSSYDNAFGTAFISDRYLRPIRDPGDDAIDEMVLIVGKPEGVTA